MANEKRLIDANEIEELFYKQLEFGATDYRDAFEYALEDAQTVDAVEVVRCKDCIFFQPYEGEEHKGDCEELVGLESCVYEDDFCSYGERRTDNENL